MEAPHGPVRVLAPLSDFFWDGETFSIPNLCEIRRLQHPPNLSLCESMLSELEKDELHTASHWLVFEQSPTDALTASEKVNVFLLALWLAVPTRTQVRFRFGLRLPDGSEVCSASRLLDRFQWILGQDQDVIETRHLTEGAKYTTLILSSYAARKRLWNSLVLTYCGCTTIHWQVAFTCLAAAVEGILTYDSGPGITKRLATSFACLTKAIDSDRDTAYESFTRSYTVRGDIMHGRIAEQPQAPESNLKRLSEFCDLLRELWKVVLTSPDTIVELEKDDSSRKTFFRRLEQGYVPPGNQRPRRLSQTK